MKTRLLLVPLLLALVASLAACGGGSQQVPPNAVAVVSGEPITLAQFNSFLAEAVAQAKSQGQTLPKAGDPAYTQMRNQVLATLVQDTELEQVASKEGISLAQIRSEASKFIANLIKTNYDGSEKKFAAALKQAGLTQEQYQRIKFRNILSQKLYEKVTAAAKVTPEEEQAYFKANAAQYPPTRSVEHILVKKKSLAEMIEKKLRNGASFAALARQYSKDPGSAAQGGKFTASKGREVPAYDDAAFALKTGELSPPIDATAPADGGYGWFIIKALGPVKQPTFSSEEAAIHTTLLDQARKKLADQWVADLQKSYKGKVSFQAGYAPPATTALPTTTG